MTEGADFSIEWDWEPGDRIAAPKHAATWARLTMRVGQDDLTLVEDRETRSTRRSIYCSLYPLAEWTAFNWWHLQADARPAGYRELGRGPSPHDARATTRLLRRHDLRGPGDGFLWPELYVLPEGGTTRLRWFRDTSVSRHRPSRFLSSGDAAIDSARVQHVFASLVESVLARLDEQGVSASLLKEEWEAIQRAAPEEREFCLAAARLGLDPYSDGALIEGDVLRAAESLDEQTLEDFLSAVDPDRMGAGLDWIDIARRLVLGSPDRARGELLRLASLRAVPAQEDPRPWSSGWRQAVDVREMLGLSPAESLPVNDLIPGEVSALEDPGIQALGSSAPGTSPVMVLGRRQSRTATRFTAARALWHAVYDRPGFFLVTSASTGRQKAERAFAAEVLAPAQGIADILGDRLASATTDDLEQVAEHFDVPALLVQHQVENQLSRSAA